MGRMMRLSPLQYNMLKMFAIDGSYVSILQAKGLDQRPFRSLLIQQWITFKPGKGFHITQKGVHAFYDFDEHSIIRKNPGLPLTAYFDATAYGLTPSKSKKTGNRAGLRIVA